VIENTIGKVQKHKQTNKQTNKQHQRQLLGHNLHLRS